MSQMEQHRDQAPTVQLSREQILAATSRCLQQEGYDATTIRKIASLLNCAVGSIYRYFRDKHELLSIVTQQVLEPVVAATESGATLAQSARLYHQVVQASPEAYRLMFWLACQAPLDAQEAAQEAAGHARLPRVIRRIIDGWAAQSDARAAERNWSLLHGLVLVGRDADACIAAMGLSDAAEGESPRARETAPAEALPARPAAARRDVPEIVITMTQPPAPRQTASAAVAAGAASAGASASAAPMASHAAPATTTSAGAAARDGKTVTASDDVCLL